MGAWMNIAIRTDASETIGTGHLMRCLTLANALLAQTGQACLFVSRTMPPSFVGRVRSAGHRWAPLPPATTTLPAGDGPPHAAWLGCSQEEDASQCIASLEGPIDGLIVDHYALDARWGAPLRAATGATILWIDDLGDRPLDADLLLDQNLQPPGADRYAGRLSAGCLELKGPQYALLRPEFAEARAKLPGGRARIFVFVSGADPDDLTGSLLRALDRRLPSEVELEAVIGGLHPKRAALEALCATRPGWSLGVDVNDIARRMARAHLGIGAGGSTTWERCAVGLPGALFVMADNQLEVVRAAVQAGVAIDVGDSRKPDWGLVADRAAALLADAAALQAMRDRCLSLVDGRGAQRVASTFSQLIAARARSLSAQPPT